MIFVIILYALLALTFPLAQYAIKYADPIFLIAFRMLVAGSCLLAYHRFIARQALRIKRADWWRFIKVSLFHIYLAFIPEFWALQYLSSLKINLMYCTTPFICAFLEYALYKKKMGRYKLAGISLGFVGMAPLIVLASPQSLLVHPHHYFFLPEAALMLAIICATYAWFIIKELMAAGYTPPFINGVAMLGGGALSLITCLVPGATSGLVFAIKPFLLTTGALILISNIIVYNLYGMLLKRYSLTFISLAGFLSPIFGALYAWLFFHEYISWHYCAAFIFIFVGLKIFYKEEQGSSIVLEEKL